MEHASVRSTWQYVITAIVLAFVLALSGSNPASAEQDLNSIIFVNASAVGAGTGESWADAFTDLQAALATAEAGQAIWVAAGAYKPTSGTSREISFVMNDGVDMYGGFAGNEDPATFDLSNRDFIANETILSGDLLDNDNGNINHAEAIRSDNSYTVVLGANAVLDGFTITGGNSNGGAEFASGSPQRSGAGMYNDKCTPTISNCLIIRNSAEFRGGGMFNSESNAVVVSSTFANNSAHFYGGGMSNSYCSPTVTDCTFSGNRAGIAGVTNSNGGGMQNTHSHPVVTGCRFIANSCGYEGGAMRNDFSNAVITNCIFAFNTSSHHGGAMMNYYGAPIITNCTFANNTSSQQGGAIRNTFSSPQIMNSIMWGNSSPTIHNWDGIPISVTYSCVQGGWTGTGNVNVDPLFAAPAEGDFYLKSEYGRWNPSLNNGEGGWALDDVTSPCIAAGNPASSFANEPQNNGGRINMGAYGNTQYASKAGHIVFVDRFEPNNTVAEAAYIGVAPGARIAELSIGDENDIDWFRFEVLRSDNLLLRVNYDRGHGDLLVNVHDIDGEVIGTAAYDDNGAMFAINGISAGTYFIRVSGVDGATNLYRLAIERGAGSTTRLIYVNDGSVTSLYYTTAAGNDANTGLAPDAPKATLQNVLATYTLGPDDLVLVDTGTYSLNSTITIPSQHGGTVYAGSPGGSNFTRAGTRFDLVGSNSNLFYGLTFSGSTTGFGFDVRSSASNNVFRANTFGAPATVIRLQGGSSNIVDGNTFTGSGTGIQLTSSAVATITNNIIAGRTDGITVAGTAIISGNTISNASSRAILLSSGSATISDNEISGAGQGVFISGGGATISGNSISGCTTGIEATPTCTIFANTLSNNTRAIVSTSTGTIIYGNEVKDGVDGIQARGRIGGTDWSEGQPNNVHGNSSRGIIADANATVQFNRIHRNSTAVSAAASVMVRNNLIYRNSGTGVLVSGVANVSVINNTIYTSAGDGIRVQNGSSNTTLRNNIIWTEDGSNLYVTTNSLTGFTSDYNNLFTTGDGKIGWMQRSFNDLFDWQIEVGYDLNSIGYTTLAPNMDNPQFIDLANDDYRLTDLTSTSIDAGNPSDDFNLEPEPNGGRINLGAYGNTSLAAPSVPGTIRIKFPNYYTDWQTTSGRTIMWDIHNVSGNVRLELHEAGVGKVLDIATVRADDGVFGWMPETSGVTGHLTKRYRIRIVSIDNPAIYAQSREPFSVPPATDSFYINNDSTANNAYTTAIGDNRNTGTTSGDPKANILALMSSHRLRPGHTVYVDTGTYFHSRTVVFSGDPILGGHEGFTITGPTDPTKIASIVRGNTASGNVAIELNGGS